MELKKPRIGPSSSFFFCSPCSGTWLPAGTASDDFGASWTPLHADLPAIGNNRFIRIAGLVTGRQRPGTASGVLFLTLEDETGNSNVVVWPRVQEQFRQALMTSQLLLVKGTLETRDNAIHIIAGALYDYSSQLKALQLKSRDFH